MSHYRAMIDQEPSWPSADEYFGSFAAERRDATPRNLPGRFALEATRTRSRAQRLPDRAMQGCAAEISAFLALVLDERSARWEEFAARRGAELGPQALAAVLLAPSARMVGEFWRRDACDFLQVTIAMTRIERAFRNCVLSDPPPGQARAARAVLLAPVPGEQHGFGLAVVADAFRRAGWRVDRCADDEHGRMIGLAETRRYDMIGLSIGGEPMLPALQVAVRRLRQCSLNRTVRIGVGGPLVGQRHDVVSLSGADFAAGDAAAAVDSA
jgi:MerR family transcriptional regulator, light-induced transcriptional regulator